MGNLRKIKRKMRLDRDLRKTLVRSTKDEILIDVDGDGMPDVALLDVSGDGDVDTLAVDLNGNGEFDLFFHDSDANGVPDMVWLNDEDEGVELVGVGPEIEQAMIAAAQAVLEQMALEEYVAQELDKELDELQQEIDQARKALRGK